MIGGNMNLGLPRPIGGNLYGDDNPYRTGSSRLPIPQGATNALNMASRNFAGGASRYSDGAVPPPWEGGPLPTGPWGTPQNMPENINLDDFRRGTTEGGWRNINGAQPQGPQPQGPVQAPQLMTERDQYQSARPNEAGYNMNPQPVQAPQDQQYGLRGAENALQQGATQGVNALIGGANAAGAALQAGGQGALGRLDSARNIIGGGVQQGVNAIGGGAARAQGMVAGGTQGGINALRGGAAVAQSRLDQAGNIIGGTVNQNVRGLQQGGSQAQQFLAAGGANAQNQINQGVNDIRQGGNEGQRILTSLFDQAVDPISGFVDPGQKAQILQAAMTGAMGPEAQKEAIANFSGDPAAKFALEEAERATLRNSAAIGGLGGGRVRQELQRQAQGIQNQQFNTRVSQLGSQAALGLNAAQSVGQLRGQQGQLSSNLAAQTGRDIAGMRQIGAGMAQDLGGAQANVARGTSQDIAQILESGGMARAGLAEQSALLQQQTGQSTAELIQSGALTRADIENGAANSIAQLIESGTLAGAEIESIAAQVEQSTGQSLAEVAQNTGINIANIAENLGSGSAELRTQAGRDLAAAIADSSTQLANLQSQQGAGLADIAGQTGAGLADSLLKEGLLDADAARQLGTLLANISVEGASSQANLAQNVGEFEAAGLIGMSNAAQTAIGSLAKQFGQNSVVRPSRDLVRIGGGDNLTSDFG